MAKGFTLIELLIVVAIIGILAAIAVPNFLNAQVRANVARVEADHKTVATSLEMYMLEHGGLPPIRATQSTQYGGYRYLTTPIAYLHGILPDPFRRRYVDGFGSNGLDQFYEFAVKPWPRSANVNSMYLVESVGPDEEDDIGTSNYPSHPNDFQFYDSTNGLRSRGEILRAGGSYVPRWYRERRGGQETTGAGWI